MPGGSGGRAPRRVLAQLTTSNRDDPLNAVRAGTPMDTRTPPLVVFAEAHSLVETSTLPFVVSACTTLSKFTQCTLPLVVIALNRTPRGTCTSKLIFARCPRQLQFMGSEETPP